MRKRDHSYAAVLFFILTSSSFVVVLSSAAQLSNQDASASVTEVTKDDFTQLATIRSTKLSVFGVKLGDSLSEARNKVEGSGLQIVASQFGAGFSAYEKQGGAELFGLRFEEERVVKIALFSGMTKYLAGESRLLLGEDVTRPESPVRLRLLGREDRYSKERHVEGSTVRCAYDKEGILLIRVSDASTVLHLIFPAKAR